MAKRKTKPKPPPGLCFVCNFPTESGNYCEKHPARTYRLLPCTESSCNRVQVRKMYGHNLFTCPEHADGSHRDTEHSRGATPGTSAREQVKALLAARRQALAREKIKQPLPPRPPYNIGHYADPRHSARNTRMG